MHNEHPTLMESHHVLICGGGLVGLVLAHGLKKHHIPYTVYERDDDAVTRGQGWAITMHWSLSALEQMLPADVWARLDSVAVDPFLKSDAGNFLVLDARNVDIMYKIPPNKRRIRANRGKLRKLLLEGLNVEFGKQLLSYQVSADSVTAKFTDGKTATGSLLVGCDGSNSAVRTHLIGVEKATPTSIPVEMHGVIQPMSRSQVAPLRALDPLLFLALNPKTGMFLWHSIHNIIPAENEGDEETYHVQTIVSHIVKAPGDILPKEASNVELLEDMKRRAVGMSEPLLSTVTNIPENTKVTRISLADWIPHPWDGQGRVTLAGDAAGSMTMYRGEGANHGFIDAACLASALVHVIQGKVTQTDALKDYEAELRSRREIAIPLSRTAALDAHRGFPSSDSPLVGGRFPPPTSLRTFF